MIELTMLWFIKIVGGSIAFIVAVILAYFLVAFPFMQIGNRIYYSSLLDDGLISLRYITVPFMAWIFHVINMFLITIKTLNSVYNLPSSINENFTVFDYVVAVIIYISIFLLIELFRYVEYKIHFKPIEDYLIVEPKEYNENGMIIKSFSDFIIEKKDEKLVFKMEKPPTLHGSDIFDDKYTEFYITGEEKCNNGNIKLFYAPLNPIRYDFLKDKY